MKTLALSLLAISLFSGLANGQDRPVHGFPDLPGDARAVAERSVACQHFWGEVNGTGDERDIQVAAALKELNCDRVTPDLKCMRSKYRENQKILTVLKEAAVE
jgi:hypothetical protein